MTTPTISVPATRAVRSEMIGRPGAENEERRRDAPCPASPSAFAHAIQTMRLRDQGTDYQDAGPEVLGGVQLPEV